MSPKKETQKSARSTPRDSRLRKSRDEGARPRAEGGSGAASKDKEAGERDRGREDRRDAGTGARHGSAAP